MIGFDYTERIAPAALIAAGCSVVFRYLSNPGWPKNLTKPEATELLAAGIPIVLNYETSGTFMLGGYSAGASAARSARAQAAALGAPPTTRIYYSADFDATAEQLPDVLAFERGAASVDGDAEVGGYGGLRVALAEDAAGFSTWQTIAWSGGQWDPRAVARQTGEQRTVGGVQVDVNQIIDLGGLGAWGGPTSGDTDMSNVIPASIAHHFPGLDLSPDFPANAPFDEATADIWADGRAEAAWRYGLMANNKLDQLLAKVGVSLDVSALAAQLGPLLHPTTDVAALATALAPHVGAPDPVAFAAALAPHIKVMSQ